MKKILSLGICLMLIISCSSDYSESETVNAGINDVAYFFGGELEYSIGKEYKRNEDDRKYFEISLRNSPNLEKFKDNPWLISSNIAYRFFRNLSQKEKENLTHIYPIITFADGQQLEFQYSIWELDFVDKRIHLVDSTVYLIRSKNFDKFTGFIDNTFLSDTDKQELIKGLKENDSQFGDVRKEPFEFVGFKYVAIKPGEDILHISGIIPRTKLNNEFSVDLDPYSDKSVIAGLDYKF